MPTGNEWPGFARLVGRAPATAMSAGRHWAPSGTCRTPRGRGSRATSTAPLSSRSGRWSDREGRARSHRRGGRASTATDSPDCQADAWAPEVASHRSETVAWSTTPPTPRIRRRSRHGADRGSAGECRLAHGRPASPASRRQSKLALSIGIVSSPRARDRVRQTAAASSPPRLCGPALVSFTAPAGSSHRPDSSPPLSAGIAMFTTVLPPVRPADPAVAPPAEPSPRDSPGNRLGSRG